MIRVCLIWVCTCGTHHWMHSTADLIGHAFGLVCIKCWNSRFCKNLFSFVRWWLIPSFAGKGFWCIRRNLLQIFPLFQPKNCRKKAIPFAAVLAMTVFVGWDLPNGFLDIFFFYLSWTHEVNGMDHQMWACLPFELAWLKFGHTTVLIFSYVLW